MRVLLSTYGSRRDVEPLVVLAVRLRALGAEVRVCAPLDEDFAQRLAGSPTSYSSASNSTGFQDHPVRSS
jgi:UDP:flavonoid glycosyltransferase YjiC (YdhE family)